MERTEAVDIINRYGMVLEEFEKQQRQILPISLLPTEEEAIKDAIKTMLAVLPIDDIENRNALIIGYASLADFFHDDIVHRYEMEPLNHIWSLKRITHSIAHMLASNASSSGSDLCTWVIDEQKRKYNMLMKEIREFVASVDTSTQGI